MNHLERKKLKKSMSLVFKQIIQLRDNNICQRCGKDVSNLGRIVSHLLPKSIYQSLAFEPKNAILTCHKCEAFWHISPIESFRFLEKEFPKLLKHLEYRRTEYGIHKVTDSQLFEIQKKLDQLLIKEKRKSCHR